ncbi:hypothetical protein ACFVSX_33080 [Streptomyces rubiginosohelvolus]|uniref:hypothetical protein n=1 Tax=Streptomyces TaxID=1883 RepID=UPI000851CF2A|nr:hypothetical protein [Streptomyces sp. EN27]
MLFASSPGTVYGVPVSLALCAVAVLLAMLLLVAVMGWAVLRRADRADLPAALLGLAHVISALCGLLPWGRPTPPPALPQRPEAGDREPEAVPTVVVLRGEPAEPTASANLSVVRREGR